MTSRAARLAPVPVFHSNLRPRSQAGLGTRGQVRFDFIGDDPSEGSDELGQYRGVITYATVFGAPLHFALEARAHNSPRHPRPSDWIEMVTVGTGATSPVWRRYRHVTARWM